MLAGLNEVAAVTTGYVSAAGGLLIGLDHKRSCPYCRHAADVSVCNMRVCVCVA